jgi:hypothetical protein
MQLKREENSFQNTNSDTSVNASAAQATSPKATNMDCSPRRRRRAGHSHAATANGSSQNAPAARS